ncbi:MAG: hypothetical protein IPF53_18110 [Blastocatellia bacterium]|nr:hypothetical protein [Blastocatellia bacterium]
MNTRTLLIVTAAIEIGAGLALAILPSAAVSVLLGLPLDSPVGLAVARIAGVALMSLAIACWLVRDDADSRAGKGLVAAMLVYNGGAVAVLAYAGVGLDRPAVLLWLAVVVHVIMAAWCGASLKRMRED